MKTNKDDYLDELIDAYINCNYDCDFCLCSKYLEDNYDVCRLLTRYKKQIMDLLLQAVEKM